MVKKFNKKIETVYRVFSEEKVSFGVFHKTLIHLHTPASHDYKLFSNWTEDEYKAATNEQLYELFFNNKIELKKRFPMDELASSVDDSFFVDFKEYISYLFLAESILQNELEIVVVTDHNTTKGVEKLQKAVSILKANNRNYKYHPHILYGVEISAADKLHIVGIFDDNKKEALKPLNYLYICCGL